MINTEGATLKPTLVTVTGIGANTLIVRLQLIPATLIGMFMVPFVVGVPLRLKTRLPLPTAKFPAGKSAVMPFALQLPAGYYILIFFDFSCSIKEIKVEGEIPVIDLKIVANALCDENPHSSAKAPTLYLLYFSEVFSLWMI